MRVAILGAGPAGLYLAYLLKRRHPGADVHVFEQNQADATFGFGVVLSDRALEFLNEDDSATYQAIAPLLETWRDIAIVHRGERIAIDGVGFAAIGRLKMLQLLQARAREAGVEQVYGRAIKELSELADADLIVGADGVNSLVRRTYANELGASVDYLSNRFAWFGTDKPFETLTQTFCETNEGFFNAHHYRFRPDMSTFIAETDETTFRSAGFEKFNEEETLKKCEEIFAGPLAGAKLISNQSIWRRFPIVGNARWSHKNCVIIGDAAHTAHFSIGSGTRLAMEDAIALDRAIAGTPGNLSGALENYETKRRPILEKIAKAAAESARWYERFPEHMKLAPLDFAISYIMRSGRIEPEKLRQMSPQFVTLYENSGRMLT